VQSHRGELTVMRPGWFLAVSVLAGLGWLAMPGAAEAHDELVSSTPIDGQSVPTSPEKVELTFSNELQSMGEGTALLVTGTDGEVVTGDLEVDGSVLRLFLGSVLPEDEYQVAYRVVSSDGHVVTGTLRFFVGPVPAELSTVPPGAPSGEDPGGVPAWVLITAGILVVVVVAALVVWRGRHRREPS
jgi:copper resistance protein C